MKPGPNSLLAFVIEIAALVIYGWAPFAFLNLPVVLELVISLIVLTIFVTLWALYAAPKSRRRLQGLALVALKLAVLLPAVFLLAWGRNWIWWVAGAAIVVTNVLIENRTSTTAPSPGE